MNKKDLGAAEYSQIKKELNEFYYKVNTNISVIFSWVYVVITLFYIFIVKNNYFALLGIISALLLALIYKLLKNRKIPIKYTYIISISYILLASVNIFLKMFFLNDSLIHYHLLLLIIGLCLVNLPTIMLFSITIFLLIISFTILSNTADFLTIKGLIRPTLLSVTMGVTFHFSIRNILYQLMSYKLKSQKREKEKERIIAELKEAISEIKTLSGLLPICSCCKKIRDDKGYWNKIDSYLASHSDVQFSHSICPDCVASLYPDIDLDKNNQ